MLKPGGRVAVSDIALKKNCLRKLRTILQPTPAVLREPFPLPITSEASWRRVSRR